MFGNIFKLRPKKFLGIDIGSSFIRVVEIGRRGQIYRLENYGEIGNIFLKKKPFRIFQHNALAFSNKEIAKTLQAILKEAGIQTKEVAFSIPDFCSFFTSFEMPAMAEEEIPQAIQYEVRPYIPLPLNEVTLDWSIIEGEPSKTPLKVLVVAIPTDIVLQYQEIAQLTDLKLKFLESEVFSLARASIKNNKEQKVTGLIDIGARSTTCSVLEKGILKISHSFNIGGNELTDIIAKSLNIDYNKAEETKIKYGLVPDRDNIRKILIPLIDSILEEVKKALRDFYLQEGKEVEEIVLSGGLAKMPGLKEYFSTTLKKRVIISDPFLRIDCPSVLVDTLREIGPTYAIAVGLALKGLE